MKLFPAWLVSETGSGPVPALTQLNENDLMQGDVTVKVEYSALK